MIALKQTETEYLLFIPASQRERAKKIEGRRWDPERRCWVYPKNDQTYRALLAEFRGDLGLPSAPDPASANDLRLQKENQELKEQIAKLYESVQLLNESLARSKQELQERDSKIADLEAQLQRFASGDLVRELQEENQKLKDEKASLYDELERLHVLRNSNSKMIDNLRENVASLNSELAQSRQALRDRDQQIASMEKKVKELEVSFETSFENCMRRVAKDACRGNEKFAKFVDGLKLDETLPNKITEGFKREMKKCWA